MKMLRVMSRVNPAKLTLLSEHQDVDDQSLLQSHLLSYWFSIKVETDQQAFHSKFPETEKLGT